jgi:hypothetical protein
MHQGSSARSRAILKARGASESGQALVLLTLMLAILLGMGALAIDVGNAFFAQRSLQASADAAALAAAAELPNGTSASAKAQQYGGNAAGKNTRFNVAGVTTSVELACVPLSPCRPHNAIYVTEEVSVPTRFARIFGVDNWEIRVRAGACSPCATRPLDIMLVLDRTLSMCQDSAGNSQPSCPDLNNAKQGMLTFLGFFDPNQDKVGLAVFPPAASSGSRCNTPHLYQTYDNTNSVYRVVSLSSDYKRANGSLNTSSNLVSTINCLRGNGVTSYANAIEHAQAELDANGRSGVQDVIVFFSDGAANYGPAYYPSSSPYRRQPCRQGVNSAGAAKSRGTLIYSIGYDLDALGGGANQCENVATGVPESPHITAYDAIRQIASNSQTFFNQPSPGELETIYTTIAGELTGARLIE